MKNTVLSTSIAGLISLIFVTSTFADVSLTLPNSAELLVINGEEASSQSPINLSNGDNQIVFKYQTKYRSHGQEQRFTSEAVIISFTAKDADYHLSLPSLRSNNQADKFDIDPVVYIEDNEGNKLASRTDTLRKEGIQLGRDYDEETLAYNETDGPAAIKALAPTSLIISLPQRSTQAEKESMVELAPALKDQKNISTMLDFWYSQADETTKNKFKAKINKDNR
jgi:uncharacterized protein YccT (UPF0319 family)